jgi:hypothetical protein
LVGFTEFTSTHAREAAHGWGIRILGGKVRAVWAVRKVPGSFAALRMTARTNNGKNNNGKNNSGKNNSGLALLDAHPCAVRLRMDGAPDRWIGLRG